MPRKIAIISAVTLTVVMGGWLLAIGARGFDSNTAGADPAPASTVDVSSGGTPTVADEAEDAQYEQMAGGGDDDRYESQDDEDEAGDVDGHDDDDGVEHEDEGEHEDID